MFGRLGRVDQVGTFRGWILMAKSLISATLSMEAREIYDSWPRQRKSRILSELIESGEGQRQQIIALQQARTKSLELLGELIVKIKLREGLTPLVERINESLFGTIYWQPYEIQEKPKEMSDLDRLNQQAFEKTGKYLF